MLNHYGLTSTYYSFDYNDVHFLMMNTEIAYGLTSLQYSFVSRDLQAASLNPSIDWIVVRMHQPMYSAGGRGDVNGFNHSTFAQVYGPLFDKYKVDLVIAAHPRNVQITAPIKYNVTTPSTPTIDPASAGTNDYTNPLGTVYAIVGTGGASLDSSTLTSPPYFKYLNNSTLGYLYCTITQSGTLMKGTFYNLSNNNAYSFSITKTV